MSNSAWNKGAIREFRTELNKKGYVYVRTNGSHDIYKHDASGRTLSVNKKLNKMVMQRLLKEINGEKTVAVNC